MSDVENWSEAAEQWIAWARTENHDAFWAYRTAFEAFVGKGEGKGVELGAGEGRISRVLGNLGWQMTLVEPVPTLLAAARKASSGQEYISSPGNAVPLEGERFDLVVLYNVLMDVDDLDGTVSEAARLLIPGGRMIVGIVHPITDVVLERERGRETHSYFEPRKVDVTIEDNELSMRFHGWRRPLSAYVAALASEGLAITRMAEPVPEPHHPVTSRLETFQGLPLFLWLELRKN